MSFNSEASDSSPVVSLEKGEKREGQRDDWGRVRWSVLRFLYGNSSLEGIKFRFKGEYKKAVKEPYEGKGLSADEFYWPVLKIIISQRLVGFTRQKKETKYHAACVHVICCFTRVINGKIIEGEAIYNFLVDFWRFLVEDFF